MIRPIAIARCLFFTLRLVAFWPKMYRLFGATTLLITSHTYFFSWCACFRVFARVWITFIPHPSLLRATLFKAPCYNPRIYWGGCREVLLNPFLVSKVALWKVLHRGYTVLKNPHPQIQVDMQWASTCVQYIHFQKHIHRKQNVHPLPAQLLAFSSQRDLWIASAFLSSVPLSGFILYMHML